MSTRYVWGKYRRSAHWKGPVYEQNYSLPAPGAHTSGSLGGYLGSDISFPDGGALASTSSPVCSIVDGSPISISSPVKCTSDKVFFATKRDGNDVYFFLQNTSIVGKCYWLIQPYGSGNEIAVNMVGEDEAGNPKRDLLNVGRYEFDGWNFDSNKFIANVSSDSKDGYPDYDDNFAYKYLGSDTIDPTAISYSTNSPRPGESITVTVTPCGNTYGGTIYYQYQYSTNGGSTWVNAGDKTADTNKSLIVLTNATQFRARVVASDNTGFTSSTYVTGVNLGINTAPTAPASVSLPALVSSAQSFTVTWAASTDAEGNLSGYQVEKSYNNGSTWVSVSASVKTTSVTDTVAAGNKTVMYRVRALDTEGLFSDWTVSAASTINTAPAAPGVITVPALINCNQNFTISWAASTDVDGNLAGYQVERSYDNGSTWISIGNAVREASTTTTVTEGNTAVLYRVRAYDDGGLYSGWTVSQSSVINQPPTASPGITLGTVRYGEYATLVWLPSEDSDGNISSYMLQRSVNGGEFETVYSGTALTFTDRSENWDWVNVQFRVQAVDNQGGLSAWVLSPKRTVQPGQLYLTGSELDLGRVVRSFDFTVTINASGERPVSGIQVAVSLDGEERLNQQVNSGDEVVLPIDLWFLNAGEHTITITASREKFLSAEGTYRFTVVPIELGEGGRLERLENCKGQAVYPVTLMEGIFRRRDGKSLESILDTLGGGGTGGDTPGTDMDITKIQVEVETLSPGSAATVELTGDSANPVFRFGIPRGADGTDGRDGAPGSDGGPGKDGAPGKAGEKGDPGDTPFIGENGNWWIGTADTGVKASCSTEAAAVQSFNGREGVVVPTKGDYTAEMVGARPADWTPSAEDVGARPNTWMPTAAEVGARSSDWMPGAEEVGAVAASSTKDIQAMTQDEYDALTSKNPTTLYLIKE